MQLAELLSPSQVLPRLPADTDRHQLLKTLTQTIISSPRGRSQHPEVLKVLEEVVLSRDLEGSTAVGEGVALPHARVAGYQGLGLAVATFAQPIRWQNHEGGVQLVFLIINPEDNPTLYLRAVAELLRPLSRPTTREKVIAAETPEALLEVLAELQINFDHPVTAADIMRTPMLTVTPEMHLRQVSLLMHEHQVEAVSVTDSEDRVIGEITCDQLFRFGVPEFFTQLKSIAFMRHYDPFESYFEHEDDQCAREVMSDHFATCPPEATLMEIVFLLSVRNHPKVYVLDKDGRRLGIIDRLSVINRIFTL